MVGLGLGQLSASAVSCSRTLVDLIEPAVEAVRLAFFTGALVRRVSADPHPLDAAGERWSLKVAGTVEEVESQLQAFHDQQVGLSDLPSRSLYRTFQTPSIVHSTRLPIQAVNWISWHDLYRYSR